MPGWQAQAARIRLHFSKGVHADHRLFHPQDSMERRLKAGQCEGPSLQGILAHHCQLSHLKIAPSSRLPRELELSLLSYSSINRRALRGAQMAGWRSLSVALALLVAFCTAAQAQGRNVLQDEMLVGSAPRAAGTFCSAGVAAAAARHACCFSSALPAGSVFAVSCSSRSSGCLHHLANHIRWGFAAPFAGCASGRRPHGPARVLPYQALLQPLPQEVSPSFHHPPAPAAAAFNLMPYGLPPNVTVFLPNNAATDGLPSTLSLPVRKGRAGRRAERRCGGAGTGGNAARQLRWLERFAAVRRRSCAACRAVLAPFLKLGRPGSLLCIHLCAVHGIVYHRGCQRSGTAAQAAGA